MTKALSNWVHEHRKAIVAGVVVFAGTYLKDSNLFQHLLTRADWWEMIPLVLGTSGLTSWVPNLNYVKTTSTK